MNKLLRMLALFAALALPAAPGFAEGVWENDPALPGTGSIDRAIEFEAADLDGRSVDSAELFAEHAVTLVFVWQTGCDGCAAELDGLDALNRARADQGGGVIAYCADAGTDASVARAREIMAPYGFPCLSKSHSADAALPWTSLPAVFFADSEGRALGEAMQGATVEQCADRFDALLSGETAPAESAVYTLYVVDQYGQPVPGAAVNFCTDTLCQLARADESGVIVFEGEPFAYHVQPVQLPEGYRFTAEDDVYTQPASGSLTLTVSRDE